MRKASLCTPATGPASGPFCEAAGTARCLDRSIAGYAPKRLFRGPVVTIRGVATKVVALNAALSRQFEIARFTHAAVRHDPIAHTAEFILSNDEFAHGGSYTLGFNGGACKEKGSPGRAFTVPRERMSFLKLGAYRAEAREAGSELIVTIHLDRPIA